MCILVSRIILTVDSLSIVIAIIEIWSLVGSLLFIDALTTFLFHILSRTVCLILSYSQDFLNLNNVIDEY